VSDAKAHLRERARARRRELAAAAPDAGERAAAHLPAHVIAGARTAAVYLPMRFEVDPAPLARRLRAAGVTILLPAVVARDEALVFRVAPHDGPLEPDAAGLPAPRAGAPAMDPDLIITPLLAFDSRGHRLGWGGGYYDRTLAALRARRPVLAVGLAFEGQRVDAVPHGPHDQKLDAILTQMGYSLIF
jgi:5-formyltetrahydrofolate cyclo-ligase